MLTLTQSQLRDKLLGLKGCVPVTISALTEVKAPLYGKPLSKLSRVNGLTGADYGRAVNRLIPFTPKPRQWGIRISPHMVRHEVDGETRYYVTLKIERSLAHVYLARHGSLLKVIRDHDLRGMLPKPDTRPVLVRDYSLGAIQRISIGGERYRIVPDPT